MLIAGSTLQNGRYVIESLLGSGGMGGVYRAEDTSLGRKVAVKQTLLPPAGSAQERLQAAAGVEQEARILAKLSHRNVVGVNDFFHEGDAYYLAMDFIEGRDLQGVVDSRKGPADLDEVQKWIEQICDALEYLHANRVLMRDLKPANLMLENGGRIRLIDFGIARIERGGDRTVSAIKGYGTAGFAPVEQYGHGHTDTRSDLYALGATIYTLVCGQRPPESVSLATGDASLRPPSEVHPQAPQMLDRVLARLMSTRKEDRYPTVAEARQALTTAFIKPLAAPPPLSTTSVFCAPSRPVQVPNGPVMGTEGLRMLEPYTVVYSGSLDGARTALEQAAQAGMKTQMLRANDPYLTMRPQFWIVVVRHVEVRGGRDVRTRQVAS